MMRQIIQLMLLGFAVVLLATPPLRAAGQPGQNAAAPAEIRRDGSTGNYTITYRVNGNIRTFEVVPATKVEPKVRSTVADIRPGYRYDYAIANGAAALQDLHAVSIDVPALGETEVTQPSGWDAIRTPQTNRLSWYKVPVGQVLDGVPPGLDVTGFRLVSPWLPKPTEARFSGAVEPPSIPGDTPPAVVSYLQRTLILRNTVTAWIITPGISLGTHEPELTPSVFLSRVHGAYARAFERSHHVARAEILVALAEAIKLMPDDRRAAIDAIDRARGLAAQAVDDEWSRSLGAALVLCLDYARSKFGL